MPIHIPPALHHRRFRLLWAGLTISATGASMQTWAILWHIRELTDQPIALAGVGVARLIPIVLFSLIGGVFADTMNRRRLLFVTQSVMMASAFMLAWLTFAGRITLWQIYLITAIQAFAVAFDAPARQSLVPNLVPARDLPSAFSMNSIGYQTGAIVGPALSGLVIAYWGQGYTYLINALTYISVLAALLLMGAVAQQVAPIKPVRVSLPAIREGIAFILASPIILSTMLLDFFATFFSSANTLMPIFARDVLNVGAVEYGWLSAAQSIGAVTAALILSQVNELRQQGIKLLVAVVMFGFATILFGLARTFLVAVVALILIGAADSISMIIRNTIRQLQTPDYLRGRMTSINQIFFMGGPQLGEVEAGVIAQLFGPVFAVISGGIGCIVAAGVIARRWPILRQYNGDEPVLAGTNTD